MRELNEGTRLAGRYTLVRHLGAGGMAQTWLANDRQADFSVALKFLDASLAGNSAYRDLLHKEWQTGSRLMHAHIVRVFEFHDDPDGAYYSMQYVGGPSIAVLAGGDPAVILRPIGLVADALRYAHGKNVVHRDIKAANVLLDRRGAPYLIDFGVAAAPGSKASGGSDIAASPQQRTGETAQPADDIYALGVLIVELVTGAPPATGADPKTISLTSSGGHDAPQGLLPLVIEMLDPDAARRPNAEAVAQRLAAAGIAAAPAPAAMIREYLPGDLEPRADKVEAIQPVRRATTAAPAAASESRSAGITPRMLYGGLAASLSVGMAVV